MWKETFYIPTFQMFLTKQYQYHTIHQNWYVSKSEIRTKIGGN